MLLCRLKIQSLRRKPLLNLHRQFSTLNQSQQSYSQIIADDLVNHLGFSKSSALSVSKKLSQPRNPRNRPDSVVNYFTHLGLSKPQIKTIVSAYPKLLSYSVEKTLEPKIQALEEIGITGKDLCNFLVKDRFFFTRSVVKQIKPSIDYLRNVLGSDEIFAQLVKKHYYYFTVYKPDLFEMNVDFLKNLGFPSEYIPKLMMNKPRCLVASSGWIEKTFHNVGKVFGISPDSKMFYHAFLASASLGSTLKTKCEVLKSLGCSGATIFEMANRFPYVLCVSVAKLRKAWHFWVDELGYELDYLVKHPNVLSFSLDKRVKPRIEVLKALNERNLNKRNVCAYTVLIKSESRFRKTWLVPYKDVIPDVVSSYLATVGSARRTDSKAFV